jgi:hypothetical protein
MPGSPHLREGRLCAVSCSTQGALRVTVPPTNVCTTRKLDVTVEESAAPPGSKVTRMTVADEAMDKGV